MQIQRQPFASLRDKPANYRGVTRTRGKKNLPMQKNEDILDLMDIEPVRGNRQPENPG